MTKKQLFAKVKCVAPVTMTTATILPPNGWSNQKALLQPLIRAVGWSSQKALFQHVIRAVDHGWSSQKALFQHVIRAEDP